MLSVATGCASATNATWLSSTRARRRGLSRLARHRPTRPGGSSTPSRTACRAHRRPLRRPSAGSLVRRADAGAGIGPPARLCSSTCWSSSSRPRGILARNDPKVRGLEGSRPGRGRLRRGARAGDGARRRRAPTASTCAAARRPACSSTSARTTRPPRATPVAGARRLHLQRRLRAADGQTCRPVVALDSSAAAVAPTAENARLNGSTNVEVREANVFDELRELEIDRRAVRHDRARSAGVRQEPGLGREGAGRLQGDQPAGAAAARPGGHLITCSCSYNVDEPLFLDVIQAAPPTPARACGVVERRAAGARPSRCSSPCQKPPISSVWSCAGSADPIGRRAQPCYSPTDRQGHRPRCACRRTDD